MTRPHQGIIAQVAADVGRDDLTIDSIARHEVFVLPSRRRLRRRSLGAGLSGHREGSARGYRRECEREKGRGDVRWPKGQHGAVRGGRNDKKEETEESPRGRM